MTPADVDSASICMTVEQANKCYQITGIIPLLQLPLEDSNTSTSENTTSPNLNLFCSSITSLLLFSPLRTYSLDQDFLL